MDHEAEVVLEEVQGRHPQDALPEETLAKVEPKMPAAGVTRVADITNLDRVGIPVFSSIRPMADRGAVSVYNGKGASPVEARVSAMMEGIERYSSEVKDRDLTVARYSDLARARMPWILQSSSFRREGTRSQL